MKLSIPSYSSVSSSNDFVVRKSVDTEINALIWFPCMKKTTCKIRDER